VAAAGPGRAAGGSPPLGSADRGAGGHGLDVARVYVLFGSKEELQLATIEAARASFVEEVVTPGRGLGPLRAGAAGRAV
jgi:hypothetical protein